MELRCNLSDDVISRIQERTDMANGAAIARQSIAMFDWATEQAQAGRQIMAIDASGNIDRWPLGNITSISQR